MKTPMQRFGVLIKVDYKSTQSAPTVKIVATDMDGEIIDDKDSQLAQAVRDLALSTMWVLLDLEHDETFYDIMMRRVIECIYSQLTDPGSVFSERFTGLLVMQDVRSITRVTQSITKRWYVFEEVSPALPVYSVDQIYDIVFATPNHAQFDEVNRQIHSHPQAKEHYMQALQRWETATSRTPA